MQSTSLGRGAVLVMALIGLVACQSLAPRTGGVSSAVPASPDRSARHVIYVHAIGLDRTPDDPASRARFARVTQTLAADGLDVIAEVRPAGTIQKAPEDLDRYAQKIAGQVRQLLAAGVPASHINVVGYSRGAVITFMSATHVAEPGVGYVLIAACMNDTGAFKGFVPVMMRYAERVRGQFLSIAEKSDPDFASCAPYFAKAAARPPLAEHIVATGKGHDFAVEPDGAWVEPVTAWIRARN